MLAAQLLNLQSAPPPPAPAAARPAPPPTGGDPWEGRDRDDTDFLEEVARLQNEYGDRVIEDPPETPTAPDELLVYVSSTHLPVEIRATVLEVEIIVKRGDEIAPISEPVDPGNFITFIAEFEGAPDRIDFIFIRPRETRPVVDPGYGRAGTSIFRIAEHTYAVAVDTTGFRGGNLRWHFWGVGEFGASKYGEIKISDQPAQLL